jgi:hypothetical protein
MAVASAALMTSASLSACSDAGEEVPRAPRGPRETVTFVNEAVAGGRDGSDPGGETTLVYAEVGAAHLADFARDDLVDDDARLAGNGLSIGSGPAARFLALGMGSPEGRERIRAAHERAGLDLAVAGLTAEQAGEPSDWEQQVGKLDAIVLGGEILGRDLSDSEANEAAGRSKESEERVIVAAHLVVALRAADSGPGEAEAGVGPDEADGLASVMAVAEDVMPAQVLADVREGVTGEFRDSVRDDLPGEVHVAMRDDFDEIRRAFAGHEEYPVQAAMFEVFRAYDQHLEAALDGGDEE